MNPSPSGREPRMWKKTQDMLQTAKPACSHKNSKPPCENHREQSLLMVQTHTMVADRENLQLPGTGVATEEKSRPKPQLAKPSSSESSIAPLMVTPSQNNRATFEILTKRWSC